MLSDRDIRREMLSGEISILPAPDDKAIQPASVDVRLGAEFIQNGYHFSANEFDLMPMEFILGTLMERVAISSRIVARIEGKSSLGRKGLGVHVTAGFVDPGWDGILTVELFNFGDAAIHLTQGMYIAQLAFDYLNTGAIRPYGHEELSSHYQGARGVQASADV